MTSYFLVETPKSNKRPISQGTKELISKETESP
jgi:hypothetical protein